MRLLRRFFGGPRKDGSAALSEALDHAISLGTALSMPSDLASHLAERHEAFTPTSETSVLVGAFLVFGEDALKFGKVARAVLASMERREVDVSELHEVEFLVLMTAIDILLTAECIASEIAQEGDQMAAVESLFTNENDPRRERMGDILAFAEMAQSVRLHRGMNSPDYASDFLEVRIRPQIPTAIAGPAAQSFAALR